ncbi:MAG: hypothetical protein RSC84_03470 [Peptostreptococcaceae bacterium]
MSIIIRDWTEFSSEVEKFRRSYNGKPKILFQEINSSKDINSKEYSVQYWIKTADEIFNKGGWLIQDDIEKIKSSLYIFGVAIVKAIDEDRYEEFGMSKEEVDTLIKKFREYAKETETRQMRLHCQE